MIGIQPRKVLAIGLMISCSTLVGCKTSIREERDALFVQNRELQDRLNSCNSALDSAQAENERLLTDIGRIQAELNRRSALPAPGPEPLPPAPGPGAFGGIAGIETIPDRGRITVRVPGDVLFAPGKVNLKQSAKTTLSRVANVIKNEYSGKVVRVRGYTDRDPIKKSKWKDNLQLSQERAAAVHRYLQERGIAPAQLEAVGMGEWHPESTKARSRRVEIVVVLE